MSPKGKGSTRSSKDKRAKAREEIFLLPFVLLFLLLAVLYASRVPIGKGIDEEAHFFYVEDIWREKHLPVLKVPHSGHYESHQPPLFYLLALPLALLGGENWRPLGRCLTVCLAILSAYICYLSAKKLYPDKRSIHIGAFAFPLLLPGHVLASACFNNDSLAEVFISLYICLLLSWLKERREGDWFWMGFTGALALLSKMTSILLLPLSLLSILITLEEKENWWLILRRVFYVCLPLFLLGGWWLLRNKLLYGDFLGWRIFQEAFATSPTPEYFLERGVSWGGYWLLVLSTGFASFWTPLLKVRFLPLPFYVVAAGFLCLSLWGVVKWLKEGERWQIKAIYLLILCVLLIFLAFIRFNLHFFEAQGRYLYPALGAFSLLISGGLGKLSRWVNLTFYFYLFLLALFSLFYLL